MHSSSGHTEFLHLFFIFRHAVVHIFTESQQGKEGWERRGVIVPTEFCIARITCVLIPCIIYHISTCTLYMYSRCTRGTAMFSSKWLSFLALHNAYLHGIASLNLTDLQYVNMTRFVQLPKIASLFHCSFFSC